MKHHLTSQNKKSILSIFGILVNQTNTEKTHTHNMTGSIELVLGPMFAGKTTELLRRVERLQIAKKKCLLVKYKKDTRYTADCVSTHNGKNVNAIPCDTLSELDSKLIEECNAIAIDEGQFFPDLLSFCTKQANEHGKIVIISALDGTFEQEPFGDVLKLLSKADSYIKLNAVCMDCGKDAAFTVRTTSQKEKEVIGGSDIYKACCRGCANKCKTQAQDNEINYII